MNDGIFRRIMFVPHNIFMDLNNVMCTDLLLNFFINCMPKWGPYMTEWCGSMVAFPYEREHVGLLHLIKVDGPKCNNLVSKSPITGHWTVILDLSMSIVTQSMPHPSLGLQPSSVPSLHLEWFTWFRAHSPIFHLTHSRGGHYIVKLRTTCEQKKYTFSKLYHQNGSKFYQCFFMSRYTWYLLHGKSW